MVEKSTFQTWAEPEQINRELYNIVQILSEVSEEIGTRKHQTFTYGVHSHLPKSSQSLALERVLRVTNITRDSADVSVTS